MGEETMIVVAERINATRKAIRAALAAHDEVKIREEARKQAEAGAAYIDVNAGSDPEKEVENLVWLVHTVQSEVDLPCAIDTSNGDAAREALAVHNGRALLNSVSAETERREVMLPVIEQTRPMVVALAMTDDGVPMTVDARVASARAAVEAVASAGIAREDIYVDPCIQPVGVDQIQGVAALEATRLIKAELEGVKTICGLSNISYGLPQRKLLNRIYLAMMAAAGMDAVIIDPTDPEMMKAVLSAAMLAGRDEFCMAYITAEREGRLA